MANIYYGDTCVALLENETVLQGLIRSGIDTPYSCESGCCQTCMLQADSGDLPIESQQSLIGKLRSQNYFLPCVCKPEHDITVVNAKLNNLYQPVQLLDRHNYNSETCRLRFSKPDNFHYHSGQFINLRFANDPSIIRSYSLSSLKHEAFVEIQLRNKQNGQLSNTLFQQLSVDDSVEIQGANGNCYYQSSASKDLLLIATNTGISPLYGIVREALQKKHKGNIYLYYGSRNTHGLYLLPELKALAEQHPNLKIQASLTNKEEAMDNTELQLGRANDLAFSEHTELNNSDLYLCGNSAMVQAAQMQGFLAGIAMNNIYADPFEHKDLRKTPR